MHKFKVSLASLIYFSINLCDFYTTFHFLAVCADEILNTHGVVWNCVYIGEWRDNLQSTL